MLPPESKEGASPGHSMEEGGRGTYVSREEPDGLRGPQPQVCQLCHQGSTPLSTTQALVQGTCPGPGPVLSQRRDGPVSSVGRFLQEVACLPLSSPAREVAGRAELGEWPQPPRRERGPHILLIPVSLLPQLQELRGEAMQPWGLRPGGWEPTCLHPPSWLGHPVPLPSLLPTAYPHRAPASPLERKGEATCPTGESAFPSAPTKGQLPPPHLSSPPTECKSS